MRRVAQFCALLFLITFAASADSIIDFTGRVGGTISTGGIGSAIVGSGIQINGLVGLDVPLNAWQQGDATISVTNGALNFSTGALLSVDHDTGSSNYSYHYDGGGTFTITGDVVAAGITGNQVLLQGSFHDGSFNIIQNGSGNGYLVMFSAAGSDTKNPSLLQYFGVPNVPFTFAGFSIGASFLGSIGAQGAFAAIAFSTDLANTAAPEPSAILAMGTCLLFVGAKLRKRLYPSTQVSSL